jgi:D-beta-D-heptose 7-phosphate kinase / D-beta-D-heptose 1-phosphate adenosyltransferase
MSYHLIDIVQNLGTPRILVIGDLILDRYVWGDAERISQEAPVILLKEDRQEVRLGGAANVAHMLRGLEAEVTMAGIVGTDLEGRLLRLELERLGVDCASVVCDTHRPTTMKQRFLGRAQHRHPHQMLRVDREVRTPISSDLANEMLNAVLPRLGEYQAILISDYAKGVCTREVAQKVIARAKECRVPVIVDPPGSGDCRSYVGATAVTPNRLETKRATGREIRSSEDAFAAGRILCAQLELDYAFVTLDSDGIALTKKDGSSEMFPTRKREVYDITGAGDMVLAMIGMGAAAGMEPENLARLANVAGGLEVEQIGVVAISREEILTDLVTHDKHRHGRAGKICSLEELARHVEARRKLHQRIIFTNGCFDVLHIGHISYLQQAAEEGDCLIVAINSDDSVRSLGKSPDRPIFHQEQRAAMLAALEAVDYVVVFHESTPHAVLERLKPDLLVKGGTYSHEEIVGWELVEAYGGQVKPLGELPGVSTTAILRQLRGEHSPQVLPHASSAQATIEPLTPERKAG